MAEPGPRISLRDGGAGPTHGGNLFPEPEVVGLWPIENAPHAGRRAALVQKFTHLLAQGFQVIAEVEIHGGCLRPAAPYLSIRPLASRSDPPLSASCCNKPDGFQRAP